MSGRAKAEDLRIEACMTGTKPDYRTGARILLPAIRRFYENPENEKAFQEWKKARDAAREGA